MADEEKDQNPVDQLVDLFVYAPVGLLYEYQEVLPKLVRRGKSQVQLARVVGQMAMNRGNPADNFTVLAEGLAGMVAKQITDIGSAIGLAPPQGDDGDDASPPPPEPVIDTRESERAEAARKADDEPADESGIDPSAADQDADQDQDGKDETEAAAERPLPIARYDELKAKEIIELLDDLEGDQLDRIRRHEEANRARKTVLGKLDRLAR